MVYHCLAKCIKFKLLVSSVSPTSLRMQEMCWQPCFCYGSELLRLTGSVGDAVVGDQTRRSSGRVPVADVSSSQAADWRHSPTAQPQAVTAVSQSRRPRGRQTGRHQSSRHQLVFTSSSFRGRFCASVIFTDSERRPSQAQKLLPGPSLLFIGRHLYKLGPIASEYGTYKSVPKTTVGYMLSAIVYGRLRTKMYVSVLWTVTIYCLGTFISWRLEYTFITIVIIAWMLAVWRDWSKNTL